MRIRMSPLFYGLLVAVSLLQQQSPAGAQSPGVTYFSNHQPSRAVASFDSETDVLTVDVIPYSDGEVPKTSAPATGADAKARLKAPEQKDFVRIDFLARDGQAFSQPYNDRFTSRQTITAPDGSTHFQDFIVSNRVHFEIRLKPNAILKETRLVAVITFTRNGHVKGPGLTTIILTPPGGGAAQSR